MDVISDLPASIEWRIYKGDNAALTIYVTDSAGLPIDMTAYTLTGQIRQAPGDATIIGTLGITVSDVNKVTVTIVDTTVVTKTAFFDIQTVKEGETRTILLGKLIATQDVTRNG